MRLNKFILILTGVGLTIISLTALLILKNNETKRNISSESSNHEFEYIYHKEKLTISISKKINKDEAFKQASKKCFEHFTKGVYPGEEKGLDIIDSCANPKKGL